MILTTFIMLVSVLFLARAFEQSWTRTIGMVMIGWIAVCSFMLGASTLSLFWLWVLK